MSVRAGTDGGGDAEEEIQTPFVRMMEIGSAMLILSLFAWMGSFPGVRWLPRELKNAAVHDDTQMLAHAYELDKSRLMFRTKVHDSRETSNQIKTLIPIRLQNGHFH